MRAVANLVVNDSNPEQANLYLPRTKWKKLVKQLDSNRLTVVLRFRGE